ncbi:MAG: hypothetical protein QHH15_06940 [Candidatus Thermoplasmatota archaeon]|jgi:hypothetical protein|nr:hypothetical protein [Candidatus Thermoplasmatota archaeon]
MKDNPYKNEISPKMKIFLIILSLLIIGIIIGQIISNIGIILFKKTAEDLNIDISSATVKRLINSYIWLVTIICIDAILLISLLWIYFHTYRKTRSSFILGLNFFIGILLIKSVLSIAYLFSFFNNSIRQLPSVLTTLGTSGFGILGFFLNIFEIIAISILLYLSLE